MYENLMKEDNEIYSLIQRERIRQREGLELIASENYVSRSVMETMGNFFTNKYAEGYPAHRYYGGCEFADEVENLAIDRLKNLFGAQHANVQPHSGAQANLSAYLAFLSPGDRILGMSLAHGGHLSHGTKINASGKFYDAYSYGVDKDTQTIDYDEVERIAKEVKPKIIVAGASAYPRKLDFERFSEIAKKVGAYLMVDMAHIAGLVVGGEHQNPVPFSDVVTLTTHKTMRGPRGGAILCKEEYKKAVDKAVFPGHQGGPLVHIIAAKAVSFKEAGSKEFTQYAKQIVKNAKVLSEELLSRGYKLVSGGTDNHLILIDTVASKNATGKEAEDRLALVGITANKNAIPFDPLPPVVTSGIRIGTPVLTTRGMKEAEMVTLAEIIDSAITEKNLEEARAKVKELTHAFPVYDNFM